MACQYIAANSVFHERNKHLHINCHILRNQLAKGFISTMHVSSKNQIAYLFTKLLVAFAFHHLLSKM
ncbi:hypothetical protein MANES_02G218860v8 [Manihot esculenta]|uniref:Uncharacterized protein n=1 Tax=Manihot esculenta TaxID=3983 RepID=A0ACB7IA21_MANES|nr:hypothetical protein MANES_02G218860v8 [Manihot esculenta]